MKTTAQKIKAHLIELALTDKLPSDLNDLDLSQFDENIDLFEQYEFLPENVRTVLADFNKKNGTYEDCNNLVKSLNKIGYTCDYGLDAQPFNLKEL